MNVLFLLGSLRDGSTNRTLAEDFRHINPKDARIVLVDAAPQVLPPFGKNLGEKAKKQLESMGVEVLLGQMVTNVDATGIEMKTQDGTVTRIDSACKVWAAGVAASPLGKLLGDKTGAEVDRAGRVHVEEDLTVKGHPEIFLVGDMINLKNNGAPDGVTYNDALLLMMRDILPNGLLGVAVAGLEPDDLLESEPLPTGPG